MSTFELTIVTAEKQAYSEQVESIVAPGADGELGILPNHTSLLTQLKSGELRIRKNGQESTLVLTGGFMEVIQNKATILADTAERDEEIDLERAEEALQRAEERIASATADMDLERALASVNRAQVRIRVARRKRSSRGSRLPPTK